MYGYKRTKKIGEMMNSLKWYKSYYENDKVFLTQEDLESYIADAKEKNIKWSK